MNIIIEYLKVFLIQIKSLPYQDDAKEQDDAKKQPSDQGPLVRLTCATEAYTIENHTCFMNNVAHFLMTGWSTVLIAIVTREDSRIYVAALIFHLFTWVVTVIMIIMIVIRRRVCAGKVLITRTLKAHCTTCRYLLPLYRKRYLIGDHWSPMILFFLC